MIDYPLDIGTRKGGNTSLSRRDVDDARPNGEAGLSFTLSGARAPRYRENARCRIDGSLYQCYSDGYPVRVIDPTNRGIGLDRGVNAC
jgi:hypothetical protein